MDLSLVGSLSIIKCQYSQLLKKALAAKQGPTIAALVLSMKNVSTVKYEVTSFQWFIADSVQKLQTCSFNCS